MFRAELAERLRTEGHDVARAGDVGLSRADDAEILTMAISQTRVLVTLDGHFGNWAVLPLARHCGVIRLRVHPTTTDNVLRVLLPLLREYTEADFSNHLVVASPGRAR
ncbi:MAG: DUF5615 family PIN-like protein, partial [Verrucomicrobiae bacterium]|nr:DUF5615 family PIN-like protein [Verrucomicrobiae bacterium]